MASFMDGHHTAIADYYTDRASARAPLAHPILGDELRALKRLRREQEPQSAVRIYAGARLDFYDCRVRPIERIESG